MGGRTLDQFNSRQQARTKNLKNVKTSVPKDADDQPDNFNERETRPADR